MNYPKPIILISACIEHNPYRYDGTTISCQIVKDMKNLVEFIPVCPEVEVGMGAPRDAVRLAKKKGESIRLISSIKGIDFTDQMIEFTKTYIDKTSETSFDGFILKAKSPTCGTDKIKVYKGVGASQPIESVDNGIFAEAIVTKYHNLPIESERRLSNFNIREHFFIRVFTTARFKEIKNKPIRYLVEFHMDHKYLLMTFSTNIMKKLGIIVANHQKLEAAEVYDLYYESLLLLFKNPPTKAKRLNVLTHIYGYFKDLLSNEEKAYYFETQNDYLDNRIPYSNLLQILKGFTIRFHQTYLIHQVIFEPYPKELLTQLDSGKKI